VQSLPWRRLYEGLAHENMQVMRSKISIVASEYSDARYTGRDVKMNQEQTELVIIQMGKDLTQGLILLQRQSNYIKDLVVKVNLLEQRVAMLENRMDLKKDITTYNDLEEY
jgi:hypothetical protein